MRSHSESKKIAHVMKTSSSASDTVLQGSKNSEGQTLIEEGN